MIYRKMVLQEFIYKEYNYNFNDIAQHYYITLRTMTERLCNIFN